MNLTNSTEAMAGRSLEEEMLRAVAYHHPIDHHKLKAVLADRRGEFDLETFRTARSNLTELGMIEHPLMDEHYYLTEEGWRALGAETPLETDETWSTVLY
ncbi:hypothetical protein ACFQDG_01145 [Natronoarchaeum mannanilyticum]|uniref:Uncharacterized protein n=1 Tax=Natronoarchaeum mannanilyticum TaxID=926360 RepID=A0AAV3TBX3_9EURY